MIGLYRAAAAAGMMLVAIVTVSGIAATTHFARVPLAAWAALTFLIAASTLIGYAVFLTLNAKVSPTLATITHVVEERPADQCKLRGPDLLHPAVERQ